MAQYKYFTVIIIHTTLPDEKMAGNITVSKRMSQHYPAEDMELIEKSKYIDVYQGDIIADNAEEAFNKAVKHQQFIIDGHKLF